MSPRALPSYRPALSTLANSKRCRVERSLHVRIQPKADISNFDLEAPLMEEAGLTRSLKLGCAMCALLIVIAIGWMIYTWSALGHDKSINSRLAMLWLDPQGVPIGVVQPPDNRWMEEAFVADVPTEEDKKIAVLVLDDHYRSGDPTYRSQSGVIGDRISKRVLCSVPSQARARRVSLDPAVQRLIRSECR